MAKTGKKKNSGPKFGTILLTIIVVALLSFGLGCLIATFFPNRTALFFYLPIIILAFLLYLIFFYLTRRKPLTYEQANALARYNGTSTSEIIDIIGITPDMDYDLQKKYSQAFGFRHLFKKKPLVLCLLAVFGFLCYSVGFFGMTVSEETPEILESFDSDQHVEEKAESRTIVIPSFLVYDGSTQAEHDHFAEEYGLKSIEKEPNGSLTLTADTEMFRANVGRLVASLSEKCGKLGYPHYVSIQVNEDGSVFTIVVNDITTASKEEKQAVTDLFLMAGLQAVQSDANIQNIRIETANKLGSIISTKNTNQ